MNTLGNVFKHLFGFCFLGDVRLRGQTGVPAERRGSYPFIDFRLLNSESSSVPGKEQTFPLKKKKILTSL